MCEDCEVCQKALNEGMTDFECEECECKYGPIMEFALPCPNCNTLMKCEVEELQGEKFRFWKCKGKCKYKFRLVADEWIRTNCR